MSWDDPYLSGRFTSDAFNTILELLNVEDPDTQICALMELGETLSYGNDEILSNFPLREMTVQMVKFLKDDRFEFLQESASHCIARFLDCHTSSTRTLIENGALEVIRDKLNSCRSIMLLRNLVHACYIISQYRPDDLGAAVGIQPLLNAINFLSNSLPDQKSVSKAINNMTSRSFYNSYINSVDSLLALMNIGDPIIAQNCLTAALNIISQAPLNTFASNQNTSIKTLCNLLPNLHDNNQIHQIVRFLYRISSNPEAGRAIIDSGFDFSVLIGSTIMDVVEYDYDDDDEDDNNNEEEDDENRNEEEGANQSRSNDRASNDNPIDAEPPVPHVDPVSHKNLSPEVITMTYQTILNLLPPPSIPGNGLWDTKRKPPSNSAEFAKRIQPILINVLLKTVEINILAIVALAQSVRLDKNFKVTNELAHSLCGFTQQQNILPYILYFVDSCPKGGNTQIFNKSGLISLLCNKHVSPEHNLHKWYENIIKKVTGGKASNIKINAFQYKSFKSIWPLIEQLKTASSCDLLQDGFFEYLHQLFDNYIESQKAKDAKKHSIFELQPLLEELSELLHFLPIQKVIDPFGNSLFDLNNSRQTVFISINNENGSKQQNESVRNRRRRHLSDDDDEGSDGDGNHYDDEEDGNNDDDDDEYDSLRRRGVRNARYNQKNCVIFTESYYNYEILHVPDSSILNKWRKSGRLGEMIHPPPDLSNVTFTELSIYHRIFNSDAYRKCTFSLNGKEIYPFDPLFRTIEMSRNKAISNSNGCNVRQDSYSTIQLTDCKNYDDKLADKLSVLEVPTNLIDPQMKKVLDFMKYLKMSIFPLMTTTKQNSSTLPKTSSSTSLLSFRNHKFESRLIMNLNSSYLTITCNTPVVQIIANYPFLFSYESRYYVYKTTTLSYISALKNTIKLKNVLHQHGRFRAVRTNSGSAGNNANNFNDHSTHIKVQMNREKVFDDGCILLQKLGHPFFLFDISFEGELGIGIGPTQEFFSLMGREFAKKKRNLWRNDILLTDSKDPEAYAMSKIGLYPIAGASLTHFELLGKFCGKAVEMGFLVPIPLSRTFFRVFKGEEIKMEDIDDQFAKSMSSATPESLDGFTFVYPGTEFEMIKNGKDIEVDAQNFENYKNLVEKFTVYKEAADAFKSGFHSVVSPGLDDMFDADDFARLISGDDTHSSNNSLTKSDLQENVLISHGYSKQSPQINQLFEIIESFSRTEKSLFIKFVTGCERLPVGGLKNLTPRLTVARKVPEISGQNVDDLLPSVMTCTNYFKLPSYSSKEIMREKILYAIQEGQGAFYLT